MRLDRAKNTRRNALYGIANKFVVMLLPFIVRTIIINTVGIEYIGISGLFTAILDILNLTELGIGSAIVYSMYKPIAENDVDTICALMNVYKRLYRVIGFCILTIGLCLLPFLTDLIHGDFPREINIYVLYLIYLGNSVATYWLFAYKTSLLNAYQRADIISLTNMVLHVLLNVIQIVVLIVFRDFYLFVLAYPLITVLINFANAYYAQKLFPAYVCRGEISHELRNDIKKRIAGLMLSKIAYKARYSVGNIVVSAFLGIQIVAIYNNYFYIVNAVTGFLTVLVVSMSAGIGNSVAMDSKEKNEADMKIINFLYMTVSFLSYCLLLGLYQPFMQLWVGQKYMFGDFLMILFAIFFLTEKSLSIVGQYYDAAGLWWEGKWKGLIEVSIHLAMIVGMSYQWGVWGTLVSTILSMSLVGLPLSCYYTYRYYFNKSFIPFLLQQLFMVVVLGCLGIISLKFAEYITRMLGFSMIKEVTVKILLMSVSAIVLYLLVFGWTKMFKDTYMWCKLRIK